jgi:hypothetical protein
MIVKGGLGMVKTINLTQNKEALVSDEDFEFLNQNKWCAHKQPKLKGFYAVKAQNIGRINGRRKQKTVHMHRLIMEKTLGRDLKRSEKIDHINHNPLDNRRENLRIATHRQNLQNQKRKTTSKYPGVYWHKQGKKWLAQIKLNGKRKYLGLFTDEREAAKAYEKAVRENCNEELICKTGV